MSTSQPRQAIRKRKLKFLGPWLQWGLGPLVAIILWSSPLPLEADAHRLAGLTAWIILWWIGEPIPLPATALWGAGGLVALGITDAKSALAPFAHPLVFLFMGGFFIARAMAAHGLDRRIALTILTQPFIAGNPWRCVVALVGVSAFLSMWISNTATTAMLLPVSLGVLSAIYPKNAGARGMVLLAVAYASSMGGTATPVGSTPNIISIAMLEEQVGFQFTFLEWMAVASPIALASLAVLIVYLYFQLPRSKSKSDVSYLNDEMKKLGRLKQGERNTLIAAFVAVFLWVMPGIIAIFAGKGSPLVTWMKSHFPEAIVSVMAACLLFMLKSDRKGTPVLTWKQAVQIDWNSLILFGGGLTLGAQIFKTGLAGVLGSNLLTLSGGSFVLFLVVVVFFAIFFTETTSNTATANMLVPLVIATAQQSGFGPVLPTVAVAIACSLAFMMPVSTPPNAIVYGSGLISIRYMMRKGVVLNIACGIIILVILTLLGPILPS